VDLLCETGVGERLMREGLVHHGIQLLFDGQAHRIPLTELTGGRSIMVYGQQEVVKDLIKARLEAGGQIIFEAGVTGVEDLTAGPPKVRYRLNGEDAVLEADFVAGCDGFWGVCRPSIPASAVTVYDKQYPFAWLGILAQTPPAGPEVMYAYNPGGFALHSM